MIKNLIFDLDGTLLDTLGDIASAITDALHEFGLPYSYDKEAAKALIGDGVDQLMLRALREEASAENLERLRPLFLPKYRAYQGRTTVPFPGMAETLGALKKRGYRLFVASNKPDALAKIIVGKTLGEGLFDEVLGHRDGDPVKPNPLQVDRLCETHGLSREECLYIGDSLTDLLTAKNAHIPCAICLYGYGRYETGFAAGAYATFSRPEEMLAAFPAR